MRVNGSLTRTCALSMLLCAAPSVAHAGPKPAATWEPASRSNYHRGRSQNITMVVIHDVEGSFDSCINWFQNPSSRVSAHYVVSKTGRIVQMVGDQDTAYHVRSANPHALGIEHEGFLSRADTWNETMLRSSAKLTRWLCDTYGLPLDRKHILGHNEVPGNTHADPGPYFPWAHYMDLVRGAGDSSTSDSGANPSDSGADPSDSGASPSDSGTGTGTGAGTGTGTGTDGSGDSSGASAPGSDGTRKRGIEGALAGEKEDTPDRKDIRYPLLERKSRGENVKELQDLLNKAGYDVSADGVFGGETDAAVRAFQRSHGLGVDGMVGSKTWHALLNQNAPAASTKTPTTSTKKSSRRPPDGPLGTNP